MTASPSLTDTIAPVDAGAHVVGLAWLRDTVAFAVADGGVVLAKDGATHRVEAHPDAGVLVAAGDGERFVTGGDDGRVAVTGADGSTRTLAEAKGAWIDTLALHAGGAYAFGAGRRVVARDDKGRERTLEVPSAARGLAFAPKGYRLAVSHYNGVSLWFPNLDAAPEALDWKGSHLDVTWSPDGRFVVTSMQENALHGWRLQPDKGHMRMSGYPSKTRCLAWSRDGKWLGTSGAEAAILWPFDSRKARPARRRGNAGCGPRRSRRPPSTRPRRCSPRPTRTAASS
jgi:WD40 repeat protein